MDWSPVRLVKLKSNPWVPLCMGGDPLCSAILVNTLTCRVVCGVVWRGLCVCCEWCAVSSAASASHWPRLFVTCNADRFLTVFSCFELVLVLNMLVRFMKRWNWGLGVVSGLMGTRGTMASFKTNCSCVCPGRLQNKVELAL